MQIIMDIGMDMEKLHTIARAILLQILNAL